MIDSPVQSSATAYGQLAERVKLESPERAARVKSVLHYDGLPLDARSVTDGVLALEGVVQGVTK